MASTRSTRLAAHECKERAGVTCRSPGPCAGYAQVQLDLCCQPGRPLAAAQPANAQLPGRCISLRQPMTWAGRESVPQPTSQTRWVEHTVLCLQVSCSHYVLLCTLPGFKLGPCRAPWISHGLLADHICANRSTCASCADRLVLQALCYSSHTSVYYSVYYSQNILTLTAKIVNCQDCQLIIAN